MSIDVHRKHRRVAREAILKYLSRSRKRDFALPQSDKDKADLVKQKTALCRSAFREFTLVI